MNSHRHARLTARDRRAPSERIAQVGIHAAARNFAISTRTAYKCLARLRI
ncbi:leucine zipper domain-containing protein [Pseudomonas sp. 2FG]